MLDQENPNRLAFFYLYGASVLSSIFIIFWADRMVACLWVTLCFTIIFFAHRKLRHTSRQQAISTATSTTDNNQIAAIAPAGLDWTIADLLPDALLVLDSTNNIQFANKTAHKTFSGLEAGLPFGLRWRAPELKEAIKMLRQTMQTLTVDYIEKGNLERAFNVAMIPLGDNHLMVIFSERTEIRRLEKMRSDFIANASHELRTPLTSLRGFIETLLGPARHDPKSHDAFLPIMQEQAERMSRLIDDLLSLSRLESRSGLTEIQTLDINHMIRQVIGGLEPLARKLDVKIIFEAADNLPTFEGNNDELFQLFQNLVENACKYGQNGGKVDISTRMIDQQIEVSVCDYGPGIEAEHIPRLTERFYRVNTDMSKKHKGTGLGLAIVKHILTHHKGRLDIQSTIGKGSKFIIRFPLAR